MRTAVPPTSNSLIDQPMARLRRSACAPDPQPPCNHGSPRPTMGVRRETAYCRDCQREGLGARLQSLAYGVGVAGDHPEVGARGLIGLGDALLPIPQRAERDLKLRGKLLLGEAERAADQLGARRPLHALEIRRGHRLRVRIAQRRSHDFLLGHGTHGFVGAAGSRRFAHASLRVRFSIVARIGALRFANAPYCGRTRAAPGQMARDTRAYCGG